MVECKDWRRRVGIETIDAIESKRRDVAADMAFVCSNSGFTRDAHRKAARVGIGIVTILQHDNQTIRSIIEFDLYVAHIDINPNRQYVLHVRPGKLPKNLNLGYLTVHGRPFINLFEIDLWNQIRQNIERNSVMLHFRFNNPAPIVVEGKTYSLGGVDITAKFNVTWKVQMIKLDASGGVYHYIHQKLEMKVPGTVFFEDVNFHGGRRVKLSEDDVNALKQGQFGVFTSLVKNAVPVAQEDFAVLTRLGPTLDNVGEKVL
jgi:hypothetical protein